MPHLGPKSVTSASRTAILNQAFAKNFATLQNTFRAIQNRPRFQFSDEFANEIQ